MKRGSLSKLVAALLVCGVIAGGFVGAAHKDYIRDQIMLWQYQPSSDIAALADHDSMTGAARRLFYVSRPEIDDKPVFAGHCPVEESTIVLGCYSGRLIHLLKVDDNRLQGVAEVSAAHETLHAAYERLSANERTRVNGMIEAAYASVVDDHLRDVMATYARTEPGERDNELHSILGTEYTHLSPELEQYYARYFTNRSQVTTLANNYKKVFDDLDNQVASYDKQLVTQKTQIDQMERQITTEQEQLSQERSRLDSLLGSGNTSQYNASVPGFNSLVSRYNNDITHLRNLVDAYNKLVVTRNEAATTQQSLVESLSTDFKPEGAK